MILQVEFQQSFRLADGVTDYDIVADVNTTNRSAHVKAVTLTATGQPGRLTRERLVAAQNKAIEVADELWS